MKVLIACEESLEAQQGKSLLLRRRPMNEIKALREATGLTQRAFADLLGIPKRSIENWESGVSNPPEYVVRLIAFYIANKEKEG